MDFKTLTKQIAAIQSSLRVQAVHAVNLALTTRNWLMGRYIVEFEQHGEDRAAFGERLLKKLEQQLNIKGLNERRFRDFRRLYIAYPQLREPIMHYISAGHDLQPLLCAESAEPIRHTPCAELELQDNHKDKWAVPADKLFNKLPYSHLKLISKIDNPVQRAFYEMEAMRGCWSARELERQIASLYYERSGLSHNREALSALVQRQAIALQPEDVDNSSVTLEFLGLQARAVVTENDLEQSILDNLQRFLLEMGHGFCFECRQKRILIDEDYFFVDLVFYHRILKCHIIVELKLDKFRHEYASQLNMYLNYFKAEVMQQDDNQPIGILLCTEKGDTLVKYATAGLDQNLFVRKYLVALPSEDEIKRFLTSRNRVQP